MYAELKRKICRECKVEKDESEFRTFKRQGRSKISRRNFCISCSAQVHFREDLWKHYRIRLPEYLDLYELQKGNCACCGIHESKFKRTLHVDHDHESGKVRGLLCTQCNPGIGYFQDSIERLEMAIKYLKKFKK